MFQSIDRRSLPLSHTVSRSDCRRGLASVRGVAAVLAVVASGLVSPAGPALASSSTHSGWTQFRGPDRNGAVASAVGLATAWPPAGPVELWRRPIGSGFSTVVVSGGLAYVAAADGEDEVLHAFEATSGKPAWRTVIGKPARSEFGDGPRATPNLVVEGSGAAGAVAASGRLFMVTSTSRLVALDATTGKILWDHDLTVYDPVPRFGYSMSPLVVDNLVIVEVGTKDLVDKATAEAASKAPAADPAAAPVAPPSSDPAAPAPAPPAFPPPVGAVAAFDVASGQLVWRGGFPGPPSYASPVVAELAGVRQLVYSRGTQVAGVSLSGELLWRHSTPQRSAIALPVILPGDVVFVSASDDHFGGLALAVTRDAAGAWQTREVWSERLMRNHFNSSVRVGSELYGFDNGTFKCLDWRTGERRWAHRGFGKGSLIAAGELLYVLGDDGTLALVHATAEAYREAGRVQAMTGKSWTSPSLAGGVLYLRDHDEVVAYDVRTATLEAVAMPAAAPGPTGATGTGDVAKARAALTTAVALPVEELLARHANARGGLARWQRLRGLELRGSYRAFSERSPFTLLRQRATPHDFFRLDYSLSSGPAVRANDGEGPWMVHPFLSPEPVRVAAVPDVAAYAPQLLREAHLTPLLLDAKARGLVVEEAGSGEINGRPTVNLRVTFPAPSGQEKGAEELWHLDPLTFLEVAIDSTVVDYTQGGDPFAQRAYFADFRQVDGLVLPHRVDLEFNARYEGMEVEAVTVDPIIDPTRFVPPPAAAPVESTP